MSSKSIAIGSFNGTSVPLAALCSSTPAAGASTSRTDLLVSTSASSSSFSTSAPSSANHITRMPCSLLTSLVGTRTGFTNAPSRGGGADGRLDAGTADQHLGLFRLRRGDDGGLTGHDV